VPMGWIYRIDVKGSYGNFKLGIVNS
jgi:hypothetical protein